MIISGLEVGMLGTNSYIIGCRQTREGAVIDPGDEGVRILDELTALKLKCKYIILTHGHGDHTGALLEVYKATGAKVLIHKNDAEKLNQPSRFSLILTGSSEVKKADICLQDGDQIKVGQLTLQVIHTPGHTPGCICLGVRDVLFTGDTLFHGSVGRSDLPGGSHTQLIDSIKTKLLVWPDSTRVYPGHGPASTIGNEKKINPFL